ncbi:MAG: DUF2786 domain-containing protein [Desulfobulbaceae bacterium]|jgi:hypothetical protein|nr:DUF2786 domain-containing protein [Desulfobulbaceae bacterium]
MATRAKLPAEEAELERLLARRWLSRLRREFAILDHRYDLKLRPPVLALHHGLNRLGFWQKGRRRLSISFDLIRQYGWAATLLVLKHEMAHQMADEQLGGGAMPHDEIFLAACRTLDLPLAFCRAVVGEEALALVQRQDGDSHPTVKRLRKLLALAQSDNIHEAALAVTKARQLLTRHQLSETDLIGDEVICLPIVLSNRRVSGVTRRLFAVISGFFPVSVIESSLYEPWLDYEMPMFEIFGRHGAAHFAVHAWHFLAERLETLWQQQRQSGNGGQRQRNSYMLGVLRGLEEKLAKSQAKETGTAARGALIAAAADPAVLARLRRRYPRIHSRKLAGRLVVSGQYEQGIEAGRRLKIHEAVAQGAAGKLLPPGEG